MIVDGDVRVLPASAATAVHRVTADPLADRLEPPEFLDVAVLEVARGALVRSAAPVDAVLEVGVSDRVAAALFRRWKWAARAALRSSTARFGCAPERPRSRFRRLVTGGAADGEASTVARGVRLTIEYQLGRATA